MTDVVSGLAPRQWNFRTGEGEWSIVEVVEHLAVIELRVQTVIASLPRAPEQEAGRDILAMDRLILERLPQRGRRFQAPEIVTPSGRWHADESVRKFIEMRANTCDLLEHAPSLRGRVMPHPAFGPWDGYQWILGTAAHTERHVGQIQRIKAHAEFPGD